MDKTPIDETKCYRQVQEGNSFRMCKHCGKTRSDHFWSEAHGELLCEKPRVSRQGIRTFNIDGVEYVPRAQLEEALDIIGGYSQLYDDMRCNPSEPTREEKREQAKLDARHSRLVKRLTGSQS